MRSFFKKPCIEAENMIATSTVATAFMARRAGAGCPLDI